MSDEQPMGDDATKLTYIKRWRKRLSTAGHNALMNEADDEIERLRAENDRLRASLNKAQAVGVARPEAPAGVMPQPAIDSLTSHQVQCDMDGVMVQVSRQALDEVLAYLALQPPPSEG